MAENKTYRCIIIDDEPIAIKVIRDHLENFNNVECLQGFTKAMDALDVLNKKDVDLLFLDINMPGISGVEFLKSLHTPPKVIFTTAYRNFAVDAFELDALDYLMKPISFERFLKSMNKFFVSMQQQELPSAQQDQKKEYIILKADKKNHKIPLDNILYIESLDNYIKVHTKGSSIICYESLSAMVKELPESDFIRIHRSYIINLNKVDVFTASYVEIGNMNFTIGRNYKEYAMKRLEKG